MSQGGEIPRGSDLEDGALAGAAAGRGGAVEVAVGCLHQTADRPVAIGAVGSRAEVVQHGQRAVGRDLKHGAATETAVHEAGVGRPLIGALPGGSVEISVSTLHQRSGRPRAVGAVRQRAKAVKRGQHAARGDPEDRAAPYQRTLIALRQVVGAAILGSPVKVSVSTLYQRADGIGAVRPDEVVQRGQGAAGRDLEDRSTVVEAVAAAAAAIGGAVEISIHALDDGGVRAGAVGVVKTHQPSESLCGQGNRRCGAKHKDDAERCCDAESGHSASFAARYLRIRPRESRESFSPSSATCQ